VVETNVHYPTDSSLLGDGARVLTRTMKKVEKATGGLKKRIRNRMRSVNKKVIAIALAGRLKGPEGEERRVERYRELVSLTRKIVHQAEGVLEEMQHLPRHRQARLKRFREILETMTGRVRQVVRQTKAWVFRGITQYPHKIVSLFEPHTEIIRKGKASKPNEFGNLVKVQEAENQIITHYEVFAERPEDSRLLVPAVEQHRRRFGCAPRIVAADAGFYSLKNEKFIQTMGVTRVAVPNRNSKSSERREPDSAGGPDAKAASACWSVVMDWIAAGIEALKACSDGSALGWSQTISFRSAAVSLCNGPKVVAAWLWDANASGGGNRHTADKHDP
jgi:IS5 family transposase